MKRDHGSTVIACRAYYGISMDQIGWRRGTAGEQACEVPGRRTGLLLMDNDERKPTLCTPQASTAPAPASTTPRPPHRQHSPFTTVLSVRADVAAHEPHIIFDRPLGGTVRLRSIAKQVRNCPCPQALTQIASCNVLTNDSVRLLCIPPWTRCEASTPHFRGLESLHMPPDPMCSFRPSRAPPWP